MRAASLLAITLAFLTVSVSADTLIMKNGTTIEGKILKQDEANYEVEVEFGTVLVPVEKVERVEADTPEMVAAREERETAGKELLEKMRAEGKVKMGGKWVSEDEKAEADEKKAVAKKKKAEAKAEAKKKADELAAKKKEETAKRLAEARQRAQQVAAANGYGYGNNMNEFDQRRGRRGRTNDRNSRTERNDYNNNYNNNGYNNGYNNNGYNNGYNNGGYNNGSYRNNTFGNGRTSGYNRGNMAGGGIRR